MDIKGKKINFLGDSITEGDGVSQPKNRYTDVFERKYGPCLIRNYGICGTCIARQHEIDENTPRYELDFCYRVDEMDSDADIVVVFGGTNDFGHGVAPVGTPKDRTPFTFWGACHVLMKRLIEKYPTSVIVFITPLHRAIEEREGMPSLREYVSVIKQTAEIHSIPVLDFYATLGIQPQIAVQRKLYAPDGLHPNDAGSERIADRLYGFLSRL